MKATEKSPEIDNFLESLTGKVRTDIVARGECMTCDTFELRFRDMLSVREYQISGLCQKCQDMYFEEEA